MFKLGCIVSLVVLIGLPVLAAQYLPWWGTCLVVLGEAVVLVVIAPKLIAAAIKRFAIGLFKTKSQVLHGAQVHIHGVQLTDKPEELSEDEDDQQEELEDQAVGDEDDADDDDYDDEEPDEPDEVHRYVLVDFTVTPMPGASKMTHWEPSELMLVPFNLANDAKEDDYASAGVARIRMVDAAGNESTDFDKITGPARLKAVFSVPAGLNGRVKLRYYFEGLGDLRLP
jgi:hypothetical protein